MARETAITSCKLMFISLCILTIGALFVYHSIETLNTSSFWKSFKKSAETYSLKNPSLSHDDASPSLDLPPYPNGLNQHIDWFIQISDIHVSKFHWPEVSTDLKSFINENVAVIQPNIVLVTGDITDSKHFNKQGSQQYMEEWETYDNIIKETKALEKTVWLDTRGNHDAFDVSSHDEEENYFRSHSAKRTTPASYRHEYKSKEGDKYSFIAVDACPDPGPRRPFNFFGLVTEENMQQLDGYMKESASSNMTLWFGHYPTSTIGSPQPGIRDIFGQGAVYMCGHLHTLGGFVPSMYAPQKSGYLELELGDWKENRFYRVMAIDHGLFSFTDEVYSKDGQWPVVLITNPKHAKFIIPAHEPLHRIAKSSHIRILTWSKAAISRVEIFVDDARLGEASSAGGPLYVLPWIPDLYSHGLHKITVTVKDAQGNERTVEQPFSLDGSRVRFDWLRRFLLMTDIAAFMKLACFAIFTVALLPLILVKVFTFKVQVAVSGQCSGYLVRFLQTWIRRYYLIAKTPGVYFPLVFSIVFLAIGPLFVGQLLQDHIGVCFVWGIFVKGAFIPGTLTFAYVFFHILLFTLPLTLYLGRCLDLSITGSHKPPSCPPAVKWVIDHSCFFIIMAFMLYLILTGFFLAYGVIALVLCPMRTWSFFLAIYMRREAMSGLTTVGVSDKQMNCHNNHKPKLGHHGPVHANS